MTKAEEVLDALSDVFTCHCGRRYRFIPQRVIGLCECGVEWGWIMPGEDVVGEYLSRDQHSGWSSWVVERGLSVPVGLSGIGDMEPV